MATFVLVHGGGHGGWCYWKVSALLRAAGHLVHAPSLSGCGDRAHGVSPATDLAMHVADVAALIEYEDLRDVILAGHSYGGMVITGAADRAHARIRTLVYLDAAHPRDGESLEMTAPVQMAMARQTMTTVGGVDLVMTPMPGMAAFFGITDPDDAAFTEARLTPHPWACFAQPLRLTNGDAAFRLPRINVNCTPSLASSPPEAKARQLDGDRNYEIDTGHDLMITEARRVADILLEIAAG
jgi:pimeloyl-ACP methyl ester carboxylesterase